MEEYRPPLPPYPRSPTPPPPPNLPRILSSGSISNLTFESKPYFSARRVHGRLLPPAAPSLGAGLAKRRLAIPVARRSPSTSTALVLRKPVRCSAVSPGSSTDPLGARVQLRHVCIIYNSLRLLLLHSEGRPRRPDLTTGMVMDDHGLRLHRDHRFVGAIPGLQIGDIFFYRSELAVVGLHAPVQGGIDYIPTRNSDYGVPIATSIVVSGGYEDDEDRGDELIYTGQGGKKRNEVQVSEDQKLIVGNLALKNSRDKGTEVRVVRGLDFESSPSGKVYVYDGLYKVVDWWKETGKSGYKVYKFRLLRVAGQEPMDSRILKLTEQLKTTPIGRRMGCLIKDISGGREKWMVPVFNELDGEKLSSFNYIVKPLYPPLVFDRRQCGGMSWGCRCITNCSDNCACAKKNGGEFAYDEKGILLKGKPLVYECGPLCKCPSSCPNRVSQNGLAFRLEIFRFREGWAVRSLDLIRAGSFVCEFTGSLLPKDSILDEDDCLIHPSQFPPSWMEWGDLSDICPDYTPPDSPSLPKLEFSIDVSKSRNIAFYLSHSNWPNLFVQFVLFDHYNTSYPHLMVFAMENIPPLTELSIDYGV